MKFVVYLIMVGFPKIFENLGFYLLQSIAEYPKLELIVLMVVVPFVTNTIQYWMVDNILKESDESRIDRLSRGKEPLIQVGPDYFMNKKVSSINDITGIE